MWQKATLRLLSSPARRIQFFHMSMTLSGLRQGKTCIQNQRYSTSPVSDEDVLKYQRDGAILLKNVFDLHWLQKVTEGIKKNVEKPSKYRDWLTNDDGSGLYFNDLCQWDVINEFRDYAKNSPAAEIAGKLMKSKNSVFFHDHVFVKEKGTQRSTPWHQDQPYYPVDGFQNCSLWMPVTHVSKETCLKFVKGSHLWKKWYIPKKFDSLENYPSDGDGIDKQYSAVDDCNFDNEEILSWEVQPGDCIAFHMKVLHGIDASAAPISRMVLVTRWLGDDATIVARPWETSPPEDAFPFTLKFGDRVVEAGQFPIFWKE